MGGSAIMFCHLKQHDDFEVLEINNSLFQEAESLFLHQVINALSARLSRTRWCHWTRGYNQLWRYRKLPHRLLKSVRQFNPDIVLTVAHGNLFWLAYRVAKQLRLPLVSIYHDWWPTLLQQNYSLAFSDSERINRRFQQLCVESDCALCISEGMRKALGDRTNSHVLHPITGRELIPPRNVIDKSIDLSEHFRILYAGNVVASYGQKLRSLIRTQPACSSFELVIHGNPHDWQEQDKNDAFKKGVLQPVIFASRFSEALSSASALLTVISFDADVAQLMSTNFPSKIATYAMFQKPLIVWAPSYSTAAKFVRQHDCALLIEDPNPHVVWQAITALSQDLPLQQKLIANVSRLHQDVLSPDKIHRAFVQHIEAVCTEKELTKKPHKKTSSKPVSLDHTHQ